MRAQYLDKMDLERERGITIKAQAVRLLHEGFELNLIDTPGHVDFTYEVSRSLEACEGAVLLVDAAQGIEAQTLANFHLARDAGLVIVPALNKIDLPAAEPDQRAKELAELLDRDPDDILRISAKSGEGVKELLAAIVARGAAAGGRRGRAAPRADLRLDVRPVPRRHLVRPHQGRLAALARTDPLDADPRGVRGGGGGRDGARGHAGRLARTGRGRLPGHRPQGRPSGEGRRHDHARRQRRCDRAAPGLPRAEADGLVRAVPGRGRRLLGAPRGARPVEALRRGAAVRARVVDGARVRVPVRVPRAAPHGHREGAAGARVRPGADRDRAERGVPRDHGRGHDRRAQPGGDAGARDVRPRGGADRVRHDHRAGGLRGHRARHLRIAPGRAGRHDVPDARARRDPLRAAAGRDRVRLLRRAEVPDARVRVARLRAVGLPGRRPGSRRRPAARRADRRVQLGGAPREGARRTAGRWWSGCAS